jgi:hypothetical protein
MIVQKQPPIRSMKVDSSTLHLNQIHHVTCNGGNDGSISVTASGRTGPYTYSWSNGGTTSMITGLVANSYLVTGY